MNIAELGTMETMGSAADNEELFITLDAVAEDESLVVVENIEAEDRDGDQMAAARPSGYNKTEYDDAVGAFFKEMARYPLLKPDEEVELAQRIKQGDQAALERLTKANLRFVVSVAKQYQNQGLTLSDLIKIGRAHV